MNRTVRLLITLLALSVAGACEEDDATLIEHEYGIALNDCAPWDGPAITVILSDSPDSIPAGVPRLVLSVWQSTATLQGRTIELGSTQGTAQQCDGSDSCEQAEAGRVHFDAVSPGDDVRGSYRLQFPGRSIRGEFRAKWLDRQLLCG